MLAGVADAAARCRHRRGEPRGHARPRRPGQVRAAREPDLLRLPGAGRRTPSRWPSRASTSSTSPTTTPSTTARPGAAQTRRAAPLGRALHRPAGRRSPTCDLPRARVAFVGFAAYRWASPIRDLDAVRALVAAAARHANVVVVFMHAGAEGAGQAHTPQPRRTRPSASCAATPGRSPTPPSTRAPTSCSAPARTSCAGIELYRGRLIAYSLGNLAGFHNFALRRPQRAERAAAGPRRPRRVVRRGHVRLAAAHGAGPAAGRPDARRGSARLDPLARGLRRPRRPVRADGTLAAP